MRHKFKPRSVLYRALEDVRDNSDHLNFSETITAARNSVPSSTIAFAAESGIGRLRFDRFEKGDFRNVPPLFEIRSICRMYGLPFDVMLNKIRLQCREMSRHRMSQKKIKKGPKGLKLSDSNYVVVAVKCGRCKKIKDCELDFFWSSRGKRYLQCKSCILKTKRRHKAKIRIYELLEEVKRLRKLVGEDV